MSEGEFDRVMSEIDQELRAESDRIPGRELRAWGAFCIRYSISMSMNDARATRIFDWFKNLYGERLNVDWDFGQTAVDIQGDLYGLRCVHFYGTMYAVCSPSLLNIRAQHRTQNGTTRTIINLLDHVQSLTPTLAQRLSAEACGEILRAYSLVFLSFSRLMGAPETVFVKEILDDLRTSASMLLGRSPNYGLSNWASLQAVEKTLKSFISIRGQEPRKIHKLKPLVEDALTLGLPNPDLTLIDTVQCEPEVRYDAKLISKARALAAHYAAMTLCSEIALLLPAPVVVQGCRKFPSESHVVSAKIRLPGGAILQGLALVFQPPKFGKTS